MPRKHLPFLLRIAAEGGGGLAMTTLLKFLLLIMENDR